MFSACPKQINTPPKPSMQSVMNENENVCQEQAVERRLDQVMEEEADVVSNRSDSAIPGLESGTEVSMDVSPGLITQGPSFDLNPSSSGSVDNVILRLDTGTPFKRLASLLWLTLAPVELSTKVSMFSCPTL